MAIESQHLRMRSYDDEMRNGEPFCGILSASAQCLFRPHRILFQFTVYDILRKKRARRHVSHTHTATKEKEGEGECKHCYFPHSPPHKKGGGGKRSMRMASFVRSVVCIVRSHLPFSFLLASPLLCQYPLHSLLPAHNGACGIVPRISTEVWRRRRRERRCIDTPPPSLSRCHFATLTFSPARRDPTPSFACEACLQCTHLSRAHSFPATGK